MTDKPINDYDTNRFLFVVGGIVGLVVLFVVGAIIFRSFRYANSVAAERKEKERLAKSVEFWKANADSIRVKLKATFENPYISQAERRSSLDAAIPSEFILETPPTLAAEFRDYKERVDRVIAQREALASQQRSQRDGSISTRAMLLSLFGGCFVVFYLLKRSLIRIEIAKKRKELGWKSEHLSRLRTDAKKYGVSI